MATTDTRTGFRLPWSSDRNQEATATEAVAQAPDEAVDDAAPAVQALVPSDGTHDPGEPTSDAVDPDPSNAIATTHAQEPAMIAFDPSPAPAPATPRKPSKLMVDLGAAIRATAEAARDQALSQVDADVAQVVEAIRNGSREGEDALRVRSDEDVAQIREWSRAEIARIKEETESRIAARKHGLDEELAAHAAAIEQRVGQVEGTAAAYRDSMHAYADSLGSEDDPSRLATLAESMPEPPELGAWADLTDLSLTYEPVGTGPDQTVATVEAVAETPDAVDETSEAGEGGEETPEAVAEPFETDEPAEIPFENIVAALGGDRGIPEAQTMTEAAQPVTDGSEPAADESAPVADAIASAAAPSWGDSPELTVSAMRRNGTGGDQADAPAADDPAVNEASDPIDRGALLAALEAAAEAVVAAESAAESADQAEAAADAAATAAEMLQVRVDADGEADPVAEMLQGRVAADGEADPAATAAMSARMDAGGFEESFVDRLAFLMPNHGEGDADGAPRTTQVIVSGLVSVASIASFKRHLGRLPGVQGVAVASGPAGEFVFNVTHRPDVSFRDAVPTMPGFAARVTNTADGVVHVTARDPESEG